jgi:hypothetical protein
LKYAEALDRKLEVFTLGLGAAHPAYDAMHDRLVRTRHPYAFYIRVPDLPAFIRQIAPALERRLVGSACEGHTGELKISMYRSGLRLVFENGRLVVSEPWKPKIKDDEGNAGFPGLTFLQLVFGFNTLSDVRVVYPDCWASPDASVVLKALFPKKASNVWVIS